MSKISLLKKMILEQIKKLREEESLVRDLELYIKQNKRKIMNFIDVQDWDTLYEMLENDFPNYDVEELINVFNEIIDY